MYGDLQQMSQGHFWQQSIPSLCTIQNLHLSQFVLHLVLGMLLGLFVF
jgi:hypothetical protein